MVNGTTGRLGPNVQQLVGQEINNYERDHVQILNHKMAALYVLGMSRKAKNVTI